MKKPDYSLKKGVNYTPPSGNRDDVVEFPAGTLVFPFWNEANIPSHIKEDFDKLKRSGATMFIRVDGDLPVEKLVMCLIGRSWVPVPRKCIRED